jgi:hypothetical protein
MILQTNTIYTRIHFKTMKINRGGAEEKHQKFIISVLRSPYLPPFGTMPLKYHLNKVTRWYIVILGQMVFLSMN